MGSTTNLLVTLDQRALQKRVAVPILCDLNIEYRHKP